MKCEDGTLKPGALKGLDPRLESFIQTHWSPVARKQYGQAIGGHKGKQAGIETRFDGRKQE